MINLIYWMAKNQMTIADLAEKSGLGTATIYRIKQGLTKPTPKTIGKLAVAFGCDVKELQNT